MRYLPMVCLVASSLIVATGCNTAIPSGPASAPLGFTVGSTPDNGKPPLVCPPTPLFCPVSGDGCIIDHGRKVSFRFALASFSPFEPGFGRLEVVDDCLGFKFVSGTIRDVDCLVNSYIGSGDFAPGSSGYPGTWDYQAVDNGDPGAGKDTFRFTVRSGPLAGYSATGTLAGGDIEPGFNPR